MDSRMHFTFSDLIAGSVVAYKADEDTFTLRTIDGREFEVALTNQTFAEVIRNLGEAYVDATGSMRDMLDRGRMLYAYGIFYPEGGGTTFEAKHIVFVGRTSHDFAFERPDWWVDQIREVADFYIRAQFPDGNIDFAEYRTRLNLEGEKLPGTRQETDTISRMVYGMASAYLLTGEDRFLEAAERGTEYLREHFRTVDAGEGIAYWVHGIDTSGAKEKKILASEFGDDYDAIPAYEQIYALAGPTQTFRVTGDPRIESDIDMTIELFNRFYLDREGGGFFSHLDPITFDPRSETLGNNQSRKNWNSVGDHAPAYLINAYLATGKRRSTRTSSRSTANTICNHFLDYDNSPFVNERFHEDWSPDHAYKWQHNRAVVGHNLKIAWNLMRINSVRPSEKYVETARKIAEVMPPIGADRQRGGWYDVMERDKGDGAGVVPLHLARPEGVVAAGAGDPRLPDPRRHPRRRRVPARGAARGGVLQRLVPRPRRGRRLLQRARERAPVPARHRAAEGQPLDVGVPQHGALLPRRRVHEPAAHEAAARPVLQAAGRRVQGPDPPRLARHPPAGLDQDRVGDDERPAVVGVRRRQADRHAAAGGRGVHGQGARRLGARDVRERRAGLERHRLDHAHGQARRDRRGTLERDLQRALDSNPQRVVLRAEGLESMSSAGARALLFLRQKLPFEDVDLYIVGAKPEVAEACRLVDTDEQSFVLVDDMASIES